MKLSELRYGEHFQCRFESYVNKDEQIFTENTVGCIQKSNVDDVYILKCGENIKMVRLVSCNDASSLDSRLIIGQTNLFEVEHNLSNNQTDVEIIFFREFRDFKDNLTINLTSEFVASAKESSFSSKDEEDLFKILHSEFMLSGSYFLFMPLYDKSEEGEVNFVMVNKDYQLSVQSGTIENETALFAVGIKQHSPHNYETGICLGHGHIEFSYLTQKTISDLNAIEIRKNMDAGKSYLGQWDQYNAEIGKRLLDNARKTGYAVVSGKPERINVYELHLNLSFNGENKSGDFTNLSEDTDKVDIVTELPDYLVYPDMTYDDWIADVDDNIKRENILDQRKTKEDKENKKWSNLSIKETGPDYIEVKTKVKKLPQRGENGELFVVSSIVGDKIQVERRRRARHNIVEGKSEISGLGLILDGTQNLSSNIPALQSNERKMSPKVQKKVFKYHPPTEHQKQAVLIALNTPDIALIQGPPGTGKTTVICAIIEALNEMFLKDNDLVGKIFVSGLQHDAVYNITKRLSVNALPTVKFGRSSQEDELSLSATQERIAEWSKNTAYMIEQRTPEVKQSLELQKLFSLFMDYKKSPSVAMEIQLLNGIKTLSERFVTPKIIERIDAILEDLKPSNESENDILLKSLYALRTDETSFLDDGVQRALELRIELENQDVPIPDCLQKACDWHKGEPLSFLADLENIKTSMIEENLPIHQYRVVKENSAVSEIVNEVSERIRQYPFDPSEKKNLALAEFVYELRNNPDGITNTLLSYNPVFAATVQQSEGREINKIRKKFELDTDTGHTPYEYVIIDEAARVAPPDLLIPMSKGKHIILVGDQRQLPQQVDQEIERKMEEAAASQEDIAFLKESTFERLFSLLDPKQRITLDEQFRMHPLLGKFISREFYEPHGEGFKSPLGAYKFVHNLPHIAGKAAVWCDVPNDSGHGSENRNKSKSRYRVSEAIAAARLLKSWLDHDKEKKMTFGIISFYSAQCTEIKKQLKELDICDDKLEIKGEYKNTAPKDEKGETEERIRIGTVDAFQGMEFDAVILCAVRSANQRRIENAYKVCLENKEEWVKKQQGLLGFLMSKNRLCVSMSRQKKALVVIGDKNLFTSDIAKDAVSELFHFYELCRDNEEYGLITDGSDISDK